MNFKSAATVGFLVFVAAGIAAPIVRGVMRRNQSKADGTVRPVQPDATVVCYFRAKVRCPACRMLEVCSQDLVEQEFAREAAAGKIEWQAIDYQSPENEHLMAEYQLLTGGVVLMEFRDGQVARCQPLPEAWNKTNDRAALSSYLHDAVIVFRKAGG